MPLRPLPLLLTLAASVARAQGAPPSPSPSSGNPPAASFAGDFAPSATAGAETGVDDKWHTSLYGFVELDGMHDSTGSYGAAANNAMLARPSSYAATHGRAQVTANNSQLGVIAAAPVYRCLKATAQAEIDFFGIQPSDATEQTTYTLGSVRMRLFFVKLEGPVVDVIAGQYHDLYAWGGAGFYPSSVAFLGLPGQIYRRQPQLRVSKTLGQRVQVELAAAAVRPVQRDGEVPDLQGGLRLMVNDRKGWGAQGFGRPDRLPLRVGLSGLARRFAVAEFLAMPGGPRIAYGWGLAANLFLPIIAASSAGDRGNALTITAEVTTGSGISDLYTQLTGGALFPTLSNPGGVDPPPLYRPNIDSGIVTYDGNGNLKPIRWDAVVVGLQYYLPVAAGRVWVSGTFSLLRSSNLLELTPVASRGGIYTRLDYFDGNLFYALTPAVQMGASYQTTHQVFGDHPVGVTAETRNHRAEAALRYFF